MTASSQTWPSVLTGRAHPSFTPYYKITLLKWGKCFYKEWSIPLLIGVCASTFIGGLFIVAFAKTLLCKILLFLVYIKSFLNIVQLFAFYIYLIMPIHLSHYYRYGEITLPARVVIA